MVIIYLSAGITSKDSSEEDKKATLRVINEENGFLNNSVMILTYALMNGRHCLEISFQMKVPSKQELLKEKGRVPWLSCSCRWASTSSSLVPSAGMHGRSGHLFLTLALPSQPLVPDSPLLLQSGRVLHLSFFQFSLKSVIRGVATAGRLIPTPIPLHCRKS